MFRLAIAGLLFLAALPAATAAAEGADSPRLPRALAVTIDDLPANPAGAIGRDAASHAAMTRKLLATLAGHQIPAVGFVNEGKLDVDGESAAEREARIAVLRLWIDGGLELGNHTYSHHSLNRTPLEEFEADVVRGEPVTRTLLAERGKTLRYFRHPFLQVGLELDKRRAFERFLGERGYTVAPVTVDNDEWIFAAIYADALRRGDADDAQKIAAAYLSYMDEVFAFIEETSRRLLGREPAQILLIHANTLNADHLGALADRIEARGYGYVTLEEALTDPAYQLADDYVGVWGLSWLHHWEITQGRPRSPSPDPPAWIQQTFDARSR